MDRLELLRAQLAAPLPHPGPAEMARFQEMVSGWSLEHFLSVPQQPPGVVVTRDEIARRLREPLPEAPGDFAAAFAKFQDDIAPFVFRVYHPRFLAFVPCAPTGYSVLGDWLCASLNAFAGVWVEGAAAAETELLVLDWFKEMLGYPAAAQGILTSGGSEANLTALAVARDRLPHADRSRAVLYQSDQRHWSVDKAARILGLAPEQVRLLPTDDDYRLPAAALEAAATRDRRAGLLPWLAVASAGTTNTGAVDPLDELAEVCRRQRLWLHVDAAYGWTAALTSHGRELLRGIEQADSLTLDPHKWFAQTFEAGCVLVRDGRLLAETFHTRPEYLQDVTPGGEQVNFADRGLALTRRFRALKIWLSLKCLGAGWFRELAERSLQLAELMELLLLGTGRFEMLCPRVLSVVCFRYRPRTPVASPAAGKGSQSSLSAGGRGDEGEGDEEYLNRLNRSIQAEALRSGRVFLTTTQLRGRTALRCCFVNWRTTAADVEEVVRLLTSIGDRLAGAPSA